MSSNEAQRKVHIAFPTQKKKKQIPIAMKNKLIKLHRERQSKQGHIRT